jgi:hypothetical protein
LTSAKSEAIIGVQDRTGGTMQSRFIAVAACMLLAVVAPLPADEPESPSGPRRGVGIEFLERFFYQTAVNDYSNAIADEMRYGNGSTEDIGTADMVASYGFRAYGVFPMSENLELEPFVRLGWAPKVLILSGASESATYINLINLDGGLDAWWLFSPGKRFSMKAGLGAYFGYSSISSSGDYTLKAYSGFPTCGVELLGGGRLAFSKVAINVNLGIPFEIINIDNYISGGNTMAQNALDHLSIFIGEGVSFR